MTDLTWRRLSRSEQRWGLGLGVIGAGGVLSGFALDGHLASVLLELGAALLLAIPLLIVERRISGSVAEARADAAKARHVAEETAEGLREVRGLVGLAGVQEAATHRRIEHVALLADRFAAEPSPANLEALFAFGSERGLRRPVYKHAVDSDLAVHCMMHTSGNGATPRLRAVRKNKGLGDLDWQPGMSFEELADAAADFMPRINAWFDLAVVLEAWVEEVRHRIEDHLSPPSGES